VAATTSIRRKFGLSVHNRKGKPPQFRTTMTTFSELDSIPGLPSTSTSTDLNYAHSALSQLITQDPDDSQSRAKLGLYDSSKITLDIIDGAQVRAARNE
jgi:hypothetical protein